MNILAINNPIKDFPLDECRTRAAKLKEEGFMIWQKWTCDGCGSRETQETPDIFFPYGECKCGHVTDIEARGCNYKMAREL